MVVAPGSYLGSSRIVTWCRYTYRGVDWRWLPARAHIPDDAGSNPAPATTDTKSSIVAFYLQCGMEQMVARKAHNLEVVGSSPTPASTWGLMDPVVGQTHREIFDVLKLPCTVAQQVEQHADIVEVAGSNPVGATENLITWN